MCTAHLGKAVKRHQTDTKVVFNLIFNETEYSVIKKCHYIILPFFLTLDGKWLDKDGNGRPEELMWQISEPNGGGLQKCTITDPLRYEYRIVDAFCKGSIAFACPMCKWKQNPILLLKGLCPNSDIEYRYVLQIGETHNDMLIFKGFNNLYILYEKYLNRWVISKTINTTDAKNIIAKQEVKQATPIGLNNWKVFDDDCPGIVPLKMTSVSCLLKIGYWYKNILNIRKLVFLNFSASVVNSLVGECINITSRCDQVIDCRDFSDENYCNRIGYQGLTYKKKISPKLSKTIKLKVDVNITVESFSRINELDMMFTSRIALQLRRRDIRLYFNDLQEGWNLLGQSDVDLMWKPTLILSNSVEMLYIADNPHVFVHILKRSKGMLVGETYLHESIRYPGSENDIIMTARFETEFFCIYQLNNYPFDSQTCHIDILSAYDIKDDVELVPGAFIDISSQESTPQFSRQLTTMLSTNNGTLLKGFIELDRMPQFHIYCTYLPTFCIITICIFTLYIEEKYIETSIMVSLTAMLVLYTLFQGISEAIPSTAYIKLIDIWLIFSLVLPFQVFLIQSVLVLWPIKKNIVHVIKIGDSNKSITSPYEDKRRQKCKLVCQIFVPVTCLLFFIFYVIFVYIKSGQNFSVELLG